MADTNFPDEWLAHSLEGVVTPELVAELREKATPQATLWETLVAQKIVSDVQILTALSDRKSTRLNSSHVSISYAVFCLKKKKKEEMTSCHLKMRDPYTIWYVLRVATRHLCS